MTFSKPLFSDVEGNWLGGNYYYQIGTERVRCTVEIASPTYFNVKVFLLCRQTGWVELFKQHNVSTEGLTKETLQTAIGIFLERAVMLLDGE